MNLLLDRLPQTVNIGGVECPIRSDFRTSIRFEMLVQNPEVSDDETVWRALRLYYPVIPHDLKRAIAKMLWFYSCGKIEESPIEDTDSEDDGADETPLSNRAYSFEHDDGYIYAAFRECYGIDLNDANMHWWKFRALFKALPDTCQFMKIIGYRSVKITSKMSKEQKSYYRKMKALYALPRSQEEQEHQKALTEALKNGSDLTGLLG